MSLRKIYDEVQAEREAPASNYSTFNHKRSRDNCRGRQSQEREYRSPTPSKSQSRTASKRREHDLEKVKEKEREKCMQERLRQKDDTRENSGKSPEDDLMFKMMDAMMFM